MGERFRGESYYYESSRREKDPEIEIKKHLDEINGLLAKLVESGPELPSDVKKAIRARIQAHLLALGLKSLEDLTGLAAIEQRLHEKRTNIPTLADYPSKEEFQQRLLELHQERRREILPNVPVKPLARQIATYGQCDWSQVKGRARDTVDYLYDLGKIMTSEFAYTATFDPTDAIEIGRNWTIENGRHRALVLRALGRRYVEEKGMDIWVTARKEK